MGRKRRGLFLPDEEAHKIKIRGEEAYVFHLSEGCFSSKDQVEKEGGGRKVAGGGGGGRAFQNLKSEN